MPLTMGLDLGTSSLKILLLDDEGRVAFVRSLRYDSFAPAPGWMEQDPAVWEGLLKEACRLAAAHSGGEEIAAIGFSGHMSGVVLVDEEGAPVCRCITLSDSRSEAECAWLEDLAGERIRENTGNPVINAFAAPKLLWMQKHWPEAFGRAARYLAPKDYLRFLLCGRLAAEHTDAANSLLLDGSGGWDRDLIRDIGLPEKLFPPILAPSAVAGSVTPAAAARYGLPAGTPVVAGGADMACGALGTGLGKAGQAAVTIGTSATFLCGVPGPSPVGQGALTYHPHALPGQYYALGSHFNGGLALNWFSRLLSPAGEIDYGLLDALAEEAEALPPTAGGLLCLPFLIGSGSPYFSPSDTAAFLGVTQVTGKAALFKSLLEGVACNLRQTLALFEEINAGPLASLRIGGGGIKTQGWAQLIVDVFGRPASTIRCPDASAVGAAVLAGHGVGLFPDMLAAAAASFETQESLAPNAGRRGVYERVFPLWQQAHDAVQGITAGLKDIAAS